MRSRPAFVSLCVAALAVAGCYIEVKDRAGEVCETDADCNDPAYHCEADNAADAGGVKRCFVAFPPGGAGKDGGTDAGVDAGPGRTVYWCNQVEPLMLTYCETCHGVDRSGSGDPKPSFRLDVYDDIDGGAAAGGLDGAKTKADRIKVRMYDFKNMPPIGSGMPTDDERSLVNDWVLSGAPFCDGGM